MIYSNKFALCLASVLVVSLSFSLFAQSADISLLKDKTSLSSDEKQTVEQWVAKQLDNLSSAITKSLSSDYSASKRKRAISGIVKNIVNASKGSDAFRNALLDSLGKYILDNVNSADIRVAIKETELLVELADVSLVDEFSSLLDTKDSAIKYLAIEGLTVLKGKIPSSAETQLINKIAKIDGGISQEVLTQQKYKFLLHSDNQVSRSLLVLALENRAKQYAQNAAGTFDADRTLVESIAKIADKLDTKSKQQVINALKDMLQTSVKLITDKKLPLEDVRGRTEMLIYSIEETLSKITGKNKTLPVISALKQVNYKKAKDSLALWVK